MHSKQKMSSDNVLWAPKSSEKESKFILGNDEIFAKCTR